MSYDSTILAASPISFYPLANSSGTTATDSADSNPGTYTGGFTLGGAAPFPSTMDGSTAFNGSTGYVDIPNAANLNPTATISLEGWVKLAATGATMQIISKGLTSNVTPFGSYGLLFNYPTATKFGFHLDIGGVIKSVASTTVPTTGVWYHVVGTYDGSNLRIYVNGVLEGTTAASGSIVYPGSPQPLQIGRYNRGGTVGEFLNGSLSSIAIYSTALSTTQVQTNYFAGPNPFVGLGTTVKPFGPTLQSAWSSGMVAAFNLGEGTGSTAADSSGNSFTGTLTGGCTWSSGTYGNHLAFADNGTTGSYLSMSSMSALNNVTAWTLSALCQLNTYTDAPKGLNVRFLIGGTRTSAAFANSSIYYHAASQSIRFNIRYTNFVDIIVPAPPLNTWVLITARVTSAHEASIWYNGVKMAATTNASYTYSGDVTSFGSLGDAYHLTSATGQNWSGPIAMGMFSSIGRTDAEIAALVTDPFVWDRPPLTVRTSQSGVLIVDQGTPTVRISQSGLLAVDQGVPKARTSQAGLLVVEQGVSTARISQYGLLLIIQPFARVSQAGVLVVDQGTPLLRVSQAGVLVVDQGTPKVRVSQTGVLAVVTLPSARVSQLGVLTVDKGTPAARVSQLGVLSVDQSASAARVSQVGTLSVDQGIPGARVSQFGVLSIVNLPSVRTSQSGVLVVDQGVPTARTSQSGLLVVDQGIPTARTSQFGILAVDEGVPTARTSQFGLLAVVTLPSVRVSQVGVLAVDQGVPASRISQTGVLVVDQGVPLVRVSQAGVLVVVNVPSVRISQIGVLAVDEGIPESRVSQVGVLAVDQGLPQVRVSQTGVLVVVPSPSTGAIPAAILPIM